jgi:hypothetical protein
MTKDQRPKGKPKWEWKKELELKSDGDIKKEPTPQGIKVIDLIYYFLGFLPFIIIGLIIWQLVLESNSQIQSNGPESIPNACEQGIRSICP